MAKKSFRIESKIYGGLNLVQKTQDMLFETAVGAMEDWRKNLDDGVGETGSHKGSYRDTGEAVNDVTISPQSEGAMAYAVGGDTIQLAIAEFGRVATPGKLPPFRPIAEWAKRKGIVSPGEDGYYPIINAIRKKIADNGLAGFAPGLKAANKNNAELEKRLQTIVEDSIIHP